MNTPVYNWTDAALKTEIATRLAANPSLMPRNVARELGLAELAIIKALPDAMRLPIAAGHAVNVWERVCLWEKVTFYAETPGMIIEIPCVLPKGKAGHGMYNVLGKGGAFGGHVLLESLGSIWLVSKPVFGLESHSVQFFDTAGALCFAMYLGRDAQKAVIPAVKAAYTEMWNHYALKEENSCA